MGPNPQGMNPMAPAPMADLDTVNAGQQGPAALQAFVDQLDPTQWEQLQQMLNGLGSDEERQAFLMDYAKQHGVLGEQAQGRMDRADALRVGTPKMGGQYGGYQVAASPLEHIGAGMQNYQANKQYKQGQADLNAANTGEQKQMADYLRMMTNR